MTDLLDLAAEADEITALHNGLAEARRLRDAGMAQTEAADGGWDTSVIDQAIRHYAASGRVFSANELRDLLPDVRQPLIGARMRAACTGRNRLLEHVGYTPSTLPSTHGHDIKTWRGIKKGDNA